jgi:hypothetical protein
VKRFVRITALFLATIFLIGAAFAWIDLFTRGNIWTDPLVKPAAGFLTTGVMFLALGLRGLRRRRVAEPTAANSNKQVQ